MFAQIAKANEWGLLSNENAEWLRQVAEQHNKQMHCDNGNIDHVGSVKDEHNTIMNTDTIDYVLRDLNLDGQDLSMLYTRFNFLCP